MAKQAGGSPAARAQQEKVKADPVLMKLVKATEASVELVRELKERLDEETWLILRSGSLGLLWAMSVLTDKPNPTEMVDGEMKSVVQHKSDAWLEGYRAGLAVASTGAAANPYAGTGNGEQSSE